MIGWDLGGAHLKAARLDESGRVLEVVQVACRLWEGMHHFHSAVDEISQRARRRPLPRRDHDRRNGRLLPQPRQRASPAWWPRSPSDWPAQTVRFYAGGRGFLDAADALRDPGAVASANWVATAALVAARQPAALLVDVGSTTTDLIPVMNGQVRAVGKDDAGRLVTGELVYTGVVRTPVMALAERAPFAGEWVPLMAEFFATTADLYRVLGRLPEGADQHPAADGGEKTVEASARRLARMLGRDFDHLHARRLPAAGGVACRGAAPPDRGRLQPALVAGAAAGRCAPRGRGSRALPGP